MFTTEDKILITINLNNSVSHVIDIDLNTFVKTERKFLNPTSRTEFDYRQANSFFADDKLFIMSSSNLALDFFVYDYENCEQH